MGLTRILRLELDEAMVEYAGRIPVKIWQSPTARIGNSTGRGKHLDAHTEEFRKFYCIKIERNFGKPYLA